MFNSKITKVIATATIAIAPFTVMAGGKPYQKSADVSGNMVSIGSDTLLGLMTDWNKEFNKQHPGYTVDITAEGSSTAPPALISGKSQFAPMSRQMKKKESEEFLLKYGYKPTPIRVAIDALAVFVNENSKLQNLNMHQVDAIFSTSRKCSAMDDIDSWDALNVGQSGQINRYSRNNVSGTYGFFKKKALCKGDYKENNTMFFAHSEELINKIKADVNGIGYSGMGYKVPGVRGVSIAKGNTSNFVEPTAEMAASGKYPLGRYLYIYVNKAKGQPLPENVAEFLRFVLSKEGQAIVKKHSFVPLPDKIIGKSLNSL